MFKFIQPKEKTHHRKQRNLVEKIHRVFMCILSLILSLTIILVSKIKKWKFGEIRGQV